MDTVVCSSTREVSDSPGGDHGLGGCASDVDAGSAQGGALDHDDGFAGVGESFGEGVGALAGAEEEDVEMC